MSLIAWYKLNGDDKNSSGKYLNTQSANLTYENGKIGQSASFNGTNSHISMTCKEGDTLDFKSSVSISLWVYPRSVTSVQYLIAKNYNSGFADNQFGLALSDTTLVAMVNGTQINTAAIFELNKWHHIGFTWDGSTVKLYKNGNLIITQAVTGYLTFKPNFSIGRRFDTYYFNGKLNDVRIYDNALSQKEIKELSKAKILHLDCNKFQEPTKNYFIQNATGSNCHPDWSVEILPDGSHKITALKDAPTAKDYNFIVNITNIVSVPANKYVTMSCKLVERSTVNLEPYMQGFGQLSGSYEGRVYKTQSYTLDWSHGIVIHAIDLASIVAGDYIIVRDFMLEYKKYPTPFVLNEREGIVKDKSGFNNHITLNRDYSPKWVSDTIVNKGCYEFDGTTYMKLPVPLKQDNTEQEWTCCAWVNLNTTATTQYMNNLNKGNAVIWTSGRPLLYLNGGANDYYIYGKSGNMTTNTWQHIAFVFRNLDGYRKIYLNGIDISDTGPNLTNTPSGIPSEMILGNLLQGKMADITMYATALSIDDIKELCSARFNIDDLGNFKGCSIDEYDRYNDGDSQTNLVVNGEHEFASNYNFSSFVYDNENNCLSRTSWASTILSDTMIPINPNDEYIASIETKKMEDINNRLYSGFQCLDKDGNSIEYQMCNHNSYTRTTLAQDLKLGDTIVYLSDDITSWSDTNGSLRYHTKQIAFWGALSEYPQYTYTRVTSYYLTKDVLNKTITLETPWTGSTVSAGTPVANAMDGGTYMYNITGNINVPIDWTKYTSPICAGWGINNNVTRFRYGTRYIKFLFLINRDAPSMPTTKIKNIKLYNLTSKQKVFCSLDSFKPQSNACLKSPEISEVGVVKGLKAWYKLNGDTKDTNINKLHGTSFGDVSFKAGMSNQKSLYFAQTRSYMELPFGQGDILPTKQYTINFWAKPETVTGYPILFSSRQTVDDRFYMGITNGKYDIGVKASTWGTGTYVATTEWTMITIVVDVNKVHLYINGVLNMSKSYSPYTLANNFRIGNQDDSGITYQYNGQIENLKIFNVPLLAEDIKTEYDIFAKSETKVKVTKEKVFLKGQIKEV